MIALRKFMLFVYIAATVALTSAQTQASEDVIEFKMVSTSGHADSPQGKSLQLWADRMSELSNGRIQGQTFFQGELGGQQEVFDQMIRGNVDMVLEIPQTSYDERIGVMTLPFLVKSWEEAQDAFAPGGWMDDIIQPIMTGVGIKFFGVYPEGFGGVATKGVYATNYEDAKKLNLKVRAIPVFPIPQTINAMGFQAVPIDWNEVYTSIQTGVVAGDSGNIIYWDFEYFGDQLDYYVHTRHNFAFSSLMMNNDVFASLDNEDQAIVAQAAQDVIDQQYIDARVFDDKWIAAAQQPGPKQMQYIEPTNEEIGAWAKVVRDLVWTEAEATFGSEIMSEVRAHTSD